MSSPEQFQGDLVSDFDGTAVKKYPKYRWQNWTKSHLPLMPGYREFVAGARDGGLRPVSFLTIRKDGGQRERATNRSIAEHDLADLFEQGVDFARNKATKARRLAQRAASFGENPVAMLEDYPDDLVPRVVKELYLRAHPDSPAILVVGAVEHPHRSERLECMRDELRDIDIDLMNLKGEGDTTVIGPGFLVDVVCLQPYSYEAGEAFAAHAVSVFRQAA